MILNESLVIDIETHWLVLYYIFALPYEIIVAIIIRYYALKMFEEISFCIKRSCNKDIADVIKLLLDFSSASDDVYMVHR